MDEHGEYPQEREVSQLREFKTNDRVQINANGGMSNLSLVKAVTGMPVSVMDYCDYQITLEAVLRSFTDPFWGRRVESNTSQPEQTSE